MFRKNWIFIYLFILLFSSSAQAYSRGFGRYELALGGDIPFYTGIQVRYNWNTQFYTKAGGGFALELLMNSHQQLTDTLDIIEHSQLLTSALENSVVANIRLGWASSIYDGPYIELGYHLMHWGRAKVKGLHISSAIGKTVNSDQTYRIHISNHGPSIHVGYRFVLTDRLTLSSDFSIYKPLFAEVNWEEGQSADEKKIADLVFNNLWFPSMGIWLGIGF